MYLDVFHCEGCGNVYQDLAVSPGNPPPPVIGGLGNSTSFHLQIEARRSAMVNRQMFKILCSDCMAACRAAIDQTLARR